MKNNNFTKKILILGASSDIGVRVVKMFLKNNWKVIGHYNKNNKELSSIKNQNLNTFKLDLSDIIQVENYLIENKKNLNQVDSFISLTGFLKLSNYQKFNIKDFYTHININYLANQLFIRNVINNMKKKKWGRILTSSSIGTKFGGGKNTYLYSLSKHMNEFIPSIFRRNAKYNILYNSLQIGVTNTKINKVDKSKMMNLRTKLIPLNRMAETKEIAKYIYYLASGENTFITLQKISISGGE